MNLYQKIISFRYTSPTAHRENRRCFCYKESDKYADCYDLDDEEFRRFLKKFMEDINISMPADTETEEKKCILGNTLDIDENDTLNINKDGIIMAMVSVGYTNYNGTITITDQSLRLTSDQLQRLTNYVIDINQKQRDNNV